MIVFVHGCYHLCLHGSTGNRGRVVAVASKNWASKHSEQHIHSISLPVTIHCKKGSRFSRPQPGCHLLNSPWAGIIKLFPARESLVSDTPAGDGKIANLFYSVLE
jgi:hypothetical protein